MGELVNFDQVFLFERRWFLWLSGGYFSDVAFLMDGLCIAVSLAGRKVYGLPADRAERDRGAELGHAESLADS
jgi:hypothetical protein